MKQQEHIRIIREIVKRKNAELDSVKEVLQNEVKFWQGESEFWSETVIQCQIQLELALAELKECSENETLIFSITKIITYQG